MNSLLSLHGLTRTSSQRKPNKDTTGTGASSQNLQDSPQQLRKLFIGGLTHDTTKEEMEAYFSQFGEVIDAVVIREPLTQHSRGFGFVTFSSIFSAESAMSHRPHILGGKAVESKRAIPRSQMLAMEPPPIFEIEPAPGCKLLLTGIDPEMHSVNRLRLYFEMFGTLDQIEIFRQPRGFGFVIFEKKMSADICLSFNLGRHTVSEREIEVQVFKTQLTGAAAHSARRRQPVDRELFEQLAHLHMMDRAKSPCVTRASSEKENNEGQRAETSEKSVEEPTVAVLGERPSQ